MNTIIWILIAVLVVVLMVLFKFKEIRHKLSLVFITLLVLFLAVSVFSVYSQHKVDLTTFEGVVDAGKIYFAWIGSLVHNIGKISGYAVNQDWGLTNSSISNSTK